MENTTNYTDKLSNSAKEELDKINRELSQIVLDKAYNYSMESNSFGKEISLSNLIDAKNDLLGKNSENNLEFLRVVKNGLRYTYTGALIIFMGVITFILFEYLSKSPTLFDRISMTVFFVVGIIFLIMGFVGLTLILNKREREIKNNIFKTDYRFNSKIVKKWSLIEYLTTEIMIKNGISNEEAKSIGAIIKYIDKLLTNEKEKEELRKLLFIRNKIIHEGYGLTMEEEVELIKIANNIILILDKK